MTFHAVSVRLVEVFVEAKECELFAVFPERDVHAIGDDVAAESVLPVVAVCGLDNPPVGYDFADDAMFLVRGGVSHAVATPGFLIPLLVAGPFSIKHIFVCTDFVEIALEQFSADGSHL